MSIITAVKNNYGKYIARGVGAAALYLCARDAHTYGKIRSDENVKTKDAIAAHYYMNNSLTLDKPSMTKNNLQNKVLRFELSENIRGFVNSFTGYFKGLGSSLVADVVPLGLGLTALFAKNSKLAKLSAVGLAIAGAFSFVKDGLGIGKANHATLPTE